MARWPEAVGGRRVLGARSQYHAEAVLATDRQDEKTVAGVMFDGVQVLLV
jgi:hypothetical protein